LSGDANDIRKTDDLALELFPDDKTLNRWLRLARDRVHFRACLRAFAGSVTASALRWAKQSTNLFGAEN